MSFTVRFSAMEGIKMAKKRENPPARGGDFRHRDLLAIVEHFEDLPDPRSDHNKEHRLIDIIVLSLCGVLAGCEAFTEIEQFGKHKEDFFRQFLDLPGGIPSHDTFGRVFQLLNPEAFEQCCLAWVRSLREDFKETSIAIDGKTLRRSFDHAKGLRPLHVLSVWCAEHSLILGQTAVDTKGNEINALPETIEKLNIEGATVSIDAAGCQRAVVSAIRKEKADYVLALKGNQGHLNDDVRAFFDASEAKNFEGIEHSFHETHDRGHGRQEHRRYYVVEVPDGIRNASLWRDLCTISMVISTVTDREKTTTERRYYIGSLPCDAQRTARSIRSHWSVENNLHWVLDVVFGEDDSRIRKGHAAENMAMLRRFTLSLIKQDQSKGSLKVKRKKAGWDNDFLVQLLATHCE
jgi:predicted transposase YbfD/YdcC